MNKVITEAEFKKRIEASTVGGYLFCGDEDYLKLHTVKLMREKVCPEPALAIFNDMRLDRVAGGYSHDQLASALAAAPMMGDAKIVTLEGLDLSEENAEDMDKLCGALAVIEEFDFNLLIVVLPEGEVNMEDIEKNKYPEKFARLCEKLTPVKFNRVPEAKLVSWIVRHFEHNGVKAETGVPRAMISKCSSNMFALSNEIDKLSYYALSMGRDAVTREDVDLIASHNEEFDTYALGAAVTSGNAELALRILGLKKAKKVEPVFILGELSNTFSDMLAVKLMTGAGASLLEISKVMKWNGTFRAEKYQEAVSGVPEERLRRAIELCVSADAALKSSYVGYEEIEKLICLAV